MRVPNLIDGSTRRPVLTLALIALAVLASLPMIPRVSLRLTGRSLIPADHPALAEADRAARRFGDRDAIVLAIETDDVYAPDNLALLARLGRDLAALDGVVAGSVASLTLAPRLHIDDDLLSPQPLLAPGQVPGPSLAARIRAETQALGLDDGALAEPTGRCAAIYAEVRPDADRAALLEAATALKRQYSNDAAVVRLGGSALAQATLGEAVAADLLKMLPLCLVALFLFMAFYYRQAAAALISMAEIGASLICTIGVMGLLEQPVFITTLALPAALLAIGVADDIYALNAYFRAAERRPGGDAIRRGFGHVRRPILLTAATTAAGLLSLAVTDLEPFRVFGLFGALAIGFSTLFTFTLLPAALTLLQPHLRKKPGRSQRALANAMSRWSAGFHQRPGRILWATGALALAAAWAAAHVRVDDSWLANLPPESELVRDSRALDRLLGGVQRLELMVDSGAPDGLLDPQRLAAVGELENALAALPEVGALQGPFTEVARINAALEGRDYRDYRDALRAGEETLSVARISQALLLTGSLRNSPLRPRLDAAYQRARLTLFVRDANYRRLSRVLATAQAPERAIARLGMTVAPFGDGFISHQTVEILVSGQTSSLLLAFLADFILIALAVRSLRTALLAIAPVALGVLLVYAALALMDIPLGIANSMFAAIAIGVGVDFSIHLAVEWNRARASGRVPTAAVRQAVGRAGPAILAGALAVSLGFGALLLSSVSPNAQLGLLTALSLLACALATLTALPALALLLERPRPAARRTKSHPSEATA